MSSRASYPNRFSKPTVEDAKRDFTRLRSGGNPNKTCFLGVLAFFLKAILDTNDFAREIREGDFVRLATKM